MRTGTYSRGILNELALCLDRDTYNVFAILDEIARLEDSEKGRSRTKDASEFRGPYLKGLWHKHHTQARFIARNLLQELARDGTVERVLRPHFGETITPELLNKLTHAIVVENYMGRGADGRLTGEWIIFAKAGAANRYLTLASHDEGDKQILDRITAYQALDTLPFPGENPRAEVRAIS